MVFVRFLECSGALIHERIVLVSRALPCLALLELARLMLPRNHARTARSLILADAQHRPAPHTSQTAAHCVDPADILQGNPLVTHAHIGAHRMPTGNVDVKEVTNVLPHPLFDSKSLDYDIALLILDSPSNVSALHRQQTPECDSARTDGESD